jgi:hypothetical protein
LPLFEQIIDLDAMKGNEQPPHVFDLPKSSLGYPILSGLDAVRSMFGLPLHEAAIIARALGFAVLSPNHFTDTPQANLANAWFLLIYGMETKAGSHVMMYAATGWLDGTGTAANVLTVLGTSRSDDPGILGEIVQHGMLHPISAVRADRGIYPAHILIDRRFLNESDPRSVELIPSHLMPDSDDGSPVESTVAS